MRLCRTRFGLRAALLAVGLAALLAWAFRLWSESRPPRLYAGWLGSRGVADRLVAAEELGRLRSGAVAALPELRRALGSDPSARVRRASAEAIGRIAAEAATPSAREETSAALLAALDDPEPAVRAEAARSLGRVLPDPDRALTPLIRAAGDPDRWARGEAVAALGLVQRHAGRDDPPARRAIVDAIHDDDEHVRELGIYAYWSTAEASPDLSSSLLGDPDVRSRRAAAAALARSSIAAGDAVPGLVAALSDPDRFVRLKAAQALGNLGSPSPAIARALSLAAADADGEVAEAARRALRAIIGG